jgi:membrane-bound lytic murein transglycosylase F
MYGPNGLETGFHYELLNRFAQDNHCNIRIIAAGKNENYIDSLKVRRADIVITHDKENLDEGLTALNKLTDNSLLIFNSEDKDAIRQMDIWIGYIKESNQFDELKSIFSGNFNPQKRAEKGVRTSRVSPYDELFKKYAEPLGWDWRMIAAVVYQESKFSISSRSHRGAQGLMQVMPQTGNYYGVDDLMDPEQNIIAGTNHLKRLQKIFSKYNLTHEELVKFTLAAYNAGEGRIIDCRNFAYAKGYDNSKWDEIVKVIPMMRDDSVLEEDSVKLGKFQGFETIDYIDSVLSHYHAICEITSL